MATVEKVLENVRGESWGWGQVRVAVCTVIEDHGVSPGF